MKQFLSHINRRLFCASLGLLLFFSVGAYSAKAQSEEKDPLGKPSIWAALEANPQDNGLWSKYFGKDLFDLTREEGIQFRTWRSQLLSAKNTPTAPKKIHAEDDALNKLTNNIAKNFILIEDYFSSEFKKLGVEYTSYHEKHPDNGFNKIVWVEEHEKKLKELWHSP